jgi:hypothetical protein
MVLIGSATLPGNGLWAKERGRLTCASKKDNLDSYLDGDEETKARLVDDGHIKFVQVVYHPGGSNCHHPGPGSIHQQGQNLRSGTRKAVSQAIAKGSFVADGVTVTAFAFFCWECTSRKCTPGKLRRFALQDGKVTEYFV